MKMKRRTFFARMKAYLYLLYLRLLRIRATPKEIALGLSIGVFVGCLPITPLQSIVVIAIALLCRASKIAGVMGTFISNPFNMIPFYIMLWYIGRTVYPMDEDFTLDFQHLTMQELLSQGTGVFARMCLGGVIIGIPIAFVTYFVAKKLLERYKNKRLQKRLEKQLRKTNSSQPL